MVFLTTQEDISVNRALKLLITYFTKNLAKCLVTCRPSRGLHHGSIHFLCFFLLPLWTKWGCGNRSRTCWLDISSWMRQFVVMWLLFVHRLVIKVPLNQLDAKWLHDRFRCHGEVQLGLLERKRWLWWNLSIIRLKFFKKFWNIRCKRCRNIMTLC